MEREICYTWYRLRGIGLVALCSFVFFFGAYLANQRSLTVNGTAAAQLLPVSHVPGEDGRLALSFDLAEGCGSVGTVLNILDKYQVKATFFVTEGWASAHQEEIRQIAASGHELGSRGSDRESMTGQSGTEIRKKLESIRKSVESVTGTPMKLFRAPYGEYDAALLQTVRASGYLPVRWDIDSEDWKDYGVESILKKVTENEQLCSGSIVRLHGGAEYTVQALETMIGRLQAKGFELTTISQLLA